MLTRIFAAMALAMLVLALMSVTIPAFSGDGGSLMAQTSDALDRYLGRSPGERSETDLLKGKASKGKGKARVSMMSRRKPPLPLNS